MRTTGAERVRETFGREIPQPDEYVGPQGPSWLHRFRVAKGLPLQLELEPDPPAWVLERFREVQAR